jgi:endonuclease-3
MLHKNIDQIINILSKKYPNKGVTTLNRMREKPNAFHILISCLLSLRARDEATEIVSVNLFKVADTPQKIIDLPMQELKKIIFKSGHYNKKAEALKHVSKILVENFNSQVPSNYEELIGIKHIGPKTANIVLAFAFGKVALPIDTHCHRIPNRIGWIKTKTPQETEKELGKILPKKYWKEFNAIFVQFGRDICNPISPKCSICPIEKHCKKISVGKSR